MLVADPRPAWRSAIPFSLCPPSCHCQAAMPVARVGTTETAAAKMFSRAAADRVVLLVAFFVQRAVRSKATPVRKSATGKWTSTDSHISGAIDSYYEYLLKCWLLFGDQDCKRMWLDSIGAINKYLADEVSRESGSLIGKLPVNELWYGHADMNTGARGATTYGALDAFFPSVLAMSGDLQRASRLQESSFKMWQQAGIEPEEFDYRTMKITSPGYPLRPEIVESTYYLYHYTKDPKYLLMGQTLWRDFVKHCRTDEGYAALKNVITKEKSDSMQSFVFAETFKYFYLLFSPPRTLNFNNAIFNTEAHPMRKQKVDSKQ